MPPTSMCVGCMRPFIYVLQDERNNLSYIHYDCLEMDQKHLSIAVLKKYTLQIEVHNSHPTANGNVGPRIYYNVGYGEVIKHKMVVENDEMLIKELHCMLCLNVCGYVMPCMKLHMLHPECLKKSMAKIRSCPGGCDQVWIPDSYYGNFQVEMPYKYNFQDRCAKITHVIQEVCEEDENVQKLVR